MQETDCAKSLRRSRAGRNELNKATTTQNKMSEKRQKKYKLELEAEHQIAWELLPWFVSGTLDDSERNLVDEHLKTCLVCRRELGALAALADAVMQRVEDVACEKALANLHDRIDDPKETAQIPWAAAASLILMIGLALIASNKVTDGLLDFGGGYQTLGASPTSEYSPLTKSARIVFHQDIDATEMVGLLDGVDATIADGPTRRGTFTIKFPSTISSRDQQHAISVLRSSGHVLFVEPVALTLNERLYQQ
jgi:hypothetical protein